MNFIKNRGLWVSKLAVIFAAYFYIAIKIGIGKGFEDIRLPAGLFTIANFSLFIAFFLLILANWLTESLKWWLITRKIESISFLTSIKAVLCGVTFGIFTPNRTGELAGRVVFLQNNNRIKGLVASATGSLSQLLITLIIGMISLIVLLSKLRFILILESSSIFLGLLFIALLIASVILLFLKFSKIIEWLSKKKLFKKYLTKLISNENYSIWFLSKITFLSLGRYLIYTFQFFLMLVIFNVQASYPNALTAISCAYLLMTIIPTSALAEIGIRGSVSIFFIGLFSTNYNGIMAATIVLWLFNLALPAVIGSIIFYRHKLSLS